MTASNQASIVHVLEFITGLKQLCNYDPSSGESGKLTDMVERMRTLVAEGQHALVFSRLTDVIFGGARLA